MIQNWAKNITERMSPRRTPSSPLRIENNKLNEKQKQLNSNWEAIKSSLEKLSNEEKSTLDELTRSNLNQLCARMTDKSINPLDLLHAFQLKVLELHQSDGNSGVCEFIFEAEQQAKALVEKLSAGLTLSSLYGIPISVKELCAVKGYDSTFGLIKLIGEPNSEDCVVIRVLREAGAIPFVLTATSQLALTTSGFNPVFGELHNPFSKNHEPGGSSTGEAVLLKRGGSPVGIGTDLLGSIRIPAAFCGICGFKPSATRISVFGLAELDPRMPLPPLRVSTGPMGRCVTDLKQVMEILFGSYMHKLDPTVPAIPFNREIYDGADRKSLIIGFYDTLNDPNLIRTVPSVRRAVQQAVEIMKTMGYRVIQFEPPKPLEALQLTLRAVSPDGGQAVSHLLATEPLCEQTRAFRLFTGLPDGLRGLVDRAAKHMFGPPAAWAKMTQKLSRPQDIQEVIYQLKRYRREFLQVMEESGQIDVLLCPVWAYPAYTKDTPAYFVNPPVIYTSLYNALDFPSGSIPMGEVNEEDVQKAKSWAEECQKNGDRYHQRLFAMQADSLGLPLAVQVVGKPYEDELVLRVMRELETRRENLLKD